MRRNKSLIFSLSLLLGVALLWSCSRTRDSFTARTYHRMVSKFNPLFNGQQALYKAQDQIERNYDYDFEEILSVYAVPNEKQAAAVKADLERAIEKGAKVVQRHSMMIRNDQKNSYIDDSYMLIGKARFLKRDFLESIETFNYVIQNFDDSKQVHEAKVWAAMGLVETDNYLAAKNYVEEVFRNKKASRRVKVEATAVFAQIEIAQKNYDGAIQLLKQAVDKTRKKEEKIRWLFIMGQLHSRLGDHMTASERFLDVIKSGPPYEILFQAQLNRARNYDVKLQRPNKVFEELRDMLADDKNIDNRDQIYYVMAEVAARLDDDVKEKEFLGLSVRNSTSNAGQKGLSYLRLGEIYFDERAYPTAAAYYDSSFQVLPADHKRYAEVELKRNSLGALVKNIETIAREDSLQRIANMTELQRNRFLDELIEKLEEADRQAELEAEQEEFFAANSTPTGGGNSGPSAGAFYFYNNNLRSIGVRDFRNKFGNRKLEDNWRRENKTAEGGFAVKTQEEEGEAGEAASEEGGDSKYKRADLLANVPLSPEAMEQSHDKIKEAFVNLATIYKEELKDFRASAKELLELLRRYPNIDTKGRVWYMLYRNYVSIPDSAEALIYKNYILNQLPESEYAELIRNEGKPKVEQDKSVIKQLYVDAYGAYSAERYQEAMEKSTIGVEKYSESEYGARFFLLRAFSLAQTDQKGKLKLALRAVIDRYPDTDEAEAANRVLAQMDEPIQATTQNSGEGAQGEGGVYVYQANEPHRYVLIVPNSGIDVNGLRNAMSDFIQKYFKLERLSSRAIFLDADNQMILVTTFPNAKSAMAFYRQVQNQGLLEAYFRTSKPQHFVISNDNFQAFYREKKAETYLKFFLEKY